MAKQRLTNPKTHPLWKSFREWAQENAVDIDGHEEDWLIWWKCFIAGAQAGTVIGVEEALNISIPV